MTSIIFQRTILADYYYYLQHNKKIGNEAVLQLEAGKAVR